MISVVADAATMAALVFVGVKMFLDDRKAARRADALSRVLDAAATTKNDLIVLVAMIRKESEGLKALAIEAERAGEGASKARTAAAFETARAGALKEELEGAVSAADRTCDRLSKLVKEAAGARKAIVDHDEPAVIDEAVVAAAGSSSKVVKLVRRK